MYQAPQPARRGTNVTLLEITFNQLYYQRPASDKISCEMTPWNPSLQAGILAVNAVDLQLHR
jgi:hypothetical protein